MTGGPPAAGATGALLERGRELEALSQRLARARDGRGSIALVEAAAGLGKTRLLEEAAAVAAAEGMGVLGACGRDLERDLAYGVALQLFERTLRSSDRERRERLFSGSAGLAAPLVMDGTPSPEGLAASLHGLYWLSANIAEEQPLLLVVDDVQWCDQPTLRFLVYLAQRIEELPIAVLLAATEGQPAQSDPLVAELRVHRATVVLRPAPLSAEAVTQGLRDSVLPEAEDDFAAACHRATGGNPLLLGELAVELAMRELEPRNGNANIVHELAPESLSAAVLLRLRKLGEEAPELARAVAVLGEDAELRHVAALTELPTERVVELADALMGAGVLGREPRLSFVHPVVRLAIYNDLSGMERTEAHRKAAGILMDEGAGAERVAPHLLAGRPAADPRAVDILMQAGQRALRGGAPDSAIRVLRRALEEPPTAEQRPDVLLALGRAEGAAGAPEAIERLTGVLDLIGEPAGRATAALDAGRMLISLARWQDAAETLSRGMEEVNGTDDALRAQLEAAYRAVSPVTTGRRLEMKPAPLDDPALESTVAGRMQLAQTAAEQALRGTTSAQEVRELAMRALGGGALLDDETCDGVAFYLATYALVVADDLQTAELATTTAVDDAQKRGSVLGFATACHFRSLAELRRGRIADAAADAMSALSATQFGWRLSLSAAVAVRAECHVEEGELATAARELKAYMDADHPVDLGAYMFVGVRGHVRLLQLSPATALEDLLESGRLLEHLGGTNPAVFPWRSLASTAALALGDRDEARRLAEEELALATAFGAPGAIGRALCALATTEEGAKAIEVREEAVRVLETSQAALDKARALVDLGGLLRRSGRRRDAREPLKLGLDLARRCGARSLAQRAREELVTVGARPRRDAATGLEALTPREAQVAGLAAQDMSNREIAEALFVTIKTVEWHLKHAFEKLSVRSRRELRSALVPDKGD